MNLSFVKEGRRAWAEKDKSSINLGYDLRKGTTFHELGHHIEFRNPEILAAALEFAQSRCAGHGPKRHPDGGAVQFAGTFLSPYVAKVYCPVVNGRFVLPEKSKTTDGFATEVMSMGCGQFENNKTLFNFLKTDPEHFYFMLGVAQAYREERT